MACTERLSVPLKAMCSSTWLMPLLAGVSSREPTRRNTPTLALCTCGTGMASSRTPLGSVRSTGPWLAVGTWAGGIWGFTDKRGFRVSAGLRAHGARQQGLGRFDAQVQGNG